MQTTILLEGRIFDLIYLYQFLKRLVIPFKKTKAFKLGIVDENGTILRKRETLQTPEEKNAYTLFDTLVFNLKKILGKIPGGKSTIASFAAALLLLREEKNRELQILQEDNIQYLEEQYYLISNYVTENRSKYSEVLDSVNSYLVESMVEMTTADFPTTQEPNPTPSDVRSYKKRNRKRLMDEFDSDEEIERYEDDVIFKVPTDVFLKSRNGKRVHEKYKEYVGEEIGNKIKQYRDLYPEKPIMLRDKHSGTMCLLRR